MALSLEKELSEKIHNHKYIIIVSSLIMFEDEGIYESSLLKEKYSDAEMEERGEDRAYKVADEIYDDKPLYDEVYEMCWKRARYVLKNRLYEIDS